MLSATTATPSSSSARRQSTCVAAGVDHLVTQFGRPSSPGVELAVTALAGALPEELLRGLAPNYIAAMLHAYRG